MEKLCHSRAVLKGASGKIQECVSPDFDRDMQEVVRHGSCPTWKLSDKTQPNDTRNCRTVSQSNTFRVGHFPPSHLKELRKQWRNPQTARRFDHPIARISGLKSLVASQLTKLV